MNGPPENASPSPDQPPPADGRPIAWLVCDPNPPIPLTPGEEVVVGRSSDATLVFRDPTVSRVHAVISVEASGTIRLQDRSTFGTFVNGERATAAEVAVGDRITVGPYELRLLGATPAASTADLTIVPGADLPVRSVSGSAELVGSLERTPLAEVLQSFEFNRKTGILTVETDHGVGRLVVEAGSPVTASFGEQRDAAAVVGMLALQSGRFAFVGQPVAEHDRTMNTTFAELVQDAERQLALQAFVTTGETGRLAPEAATRIVSDGLELGATDQTLVRYLFRHCREVRLKKLAGGYSGNVVAATESTDSHGHEQAPHVVKLGRLGPMRQERDAFLGIHEVLGNSAPQISDFAELNDRAAIKYRYASMSGGFSTTFQKQFQKGIGLDKVRQVLDTVFGEQLMRLYKAARLEACDLLEHYQFSARWADAVRRDVEAVLGEPCASGAPMEIVPGVRVENVCDFYEQVLERLPRRRDERCYQAFVHGDLNGGNIILDGRDNVWLIDFSHATRAHVLRDLIKFENDVLYVLTPIAGIEDLRDAFAVTDALVGVADLAAPFTASCPSARPQLVRAWETVRLLRAYYPRLLQADGDPYQFWVGSLRYAVHTLAFDESDAWQRRWALYTAARCVERIRNARSEAGQPSA